MSCWYFLEYQEDNDDVEHNLDRKFSISNERELETKTLDRLYRKVFTVFFFICRKPIT